MDARTAPHPGAHHPALDRKSVGAVVLGNALEFYDFTVYAFFAKPIGEAFFPANDPTHSLLASLALFGIGYVMRPIGGVLIGAFADRAGRKPAMLITIALMELNASRGNEWQLLTAGAFISMILPLAVFFSLQRFFVRGLTAGSVKG